MAPYFFSAITNIIKSLNNTKKFHGKFGSIYSFFALFFGGRRIWNVSGERVSKKSIFTKLYY
jgi:hypothetical protein